ncbi:hypothetical protein GOP47_0021109 [Adiantum capillus-veneris]|uniref:Uncharacterized protein n=1 Tax=Adiantum capillus-veneris TaxID=13818 RepID=A0A9D4UC16_ADICA|nr:hypothetical protein GOP47_0021109 [Adiantum capillus-veneris]
MPWQNVVGEKSKSLFSGPTMEWAASYTWTHTMSTAFSVPNAERALGLQLHQDGDKNSSHKPQSHSSKPALRITKMRVVIIVECYLAWTLLSLRRTTEWRKRKVRSSELNN